MDGERFDTLLRQTFGGASRRSLLRAGIGALATSLFAAFGLSAIDNAAAKKKKKKKKKKKSPPAPVQTCTGDRPITCGTGCCSSQFPLCCPDSFSVEGVSCNPAGRTCCTLAQGGGSCGGETPKCCAATPEVPFGSCTESTSVCCAAGTGGDFTGSCLAGFSCCPNDVSNTGNFGCCPTGSDCCEVDEDCGDPNDFNCMDGCCEPAP